MNVYDRAIKSWGIMAQLGMVQEECAELIAAINKFRRSNSPEIVIDELIDVEIMLEQMRHIFPADQWEAKRAYKLQRLELKLNSSACSQKTQEE